MCLSYEITGNENFGIHSPFWRQLSGKLGKWATTCAHFPRARARINMCQSDGEKKTKILQPIRKNIYLQKITFRKKKKFFFLNTTQTKRPYTRSTNSRTSAKTFPERSYPIVVWRGIFSRLSPSLRALFYFLNFRLKTPAKAALRRLTCPHRSAVGRRLRGMRAHRRRKSLGSAGRRLRCAGNVLARGNGVQNQKSLSAMFIFDCGFIARGRVGKVRTVENLWGTTALFSARLQSRFFRWIRSVV